jgi:hypothetical protein
VKDNLKSPALGAAGWVAAVVLLGLLAVAVAYGVHAWTALGGVAMSGAGWLFLVLGAVFTLAVGGGLMWLVFYSSRHNFDR